MNKKQLIFSVCLLLVVLAALGAYLIKNNNPQQNPAEEVPKVRYTTGMVFGYFDTITVIDGYTSTEEEFDAIVTELLEELGEYHKLFDIYNAYSGIKNIRSINRLHDGEHKVVTVDRRIIDMLLYAKKMYNVTGGEMNIAMGSVLSIWHDYRSDALDGGVPKLPPMEDLEEAAEHTDINDLIIDEENCTVYIADPKMTLDVGAIAKGYTVEMLAQMLEAKGISGFVINVGGNVRTVGAKANGETWLSAIENPFDDEEERYLAYLGLAGQSIVTSGSYQRYYYVNGKKYHHIIDKETLMPAVGFESVSIVCENSADGDGLSTALFCMSLEDGMALIESLEGVEAHWVLSDGTRVKSSGFANFEVEYNP